MKPIDAVEMLVAMDLSSLSLSDAYDRLSPAPGAYQVLRCASQLVPMALLCLNGWSIPVELDFSYGQDEWSLHTCTWDHEAGKLNTRSIWSPGA